MVPGRQLDMFVFKLAVVGKDLQDTLQANRAGCVGMAANIREGKVRMCHAGM